MEGVERIIKQIKVVNQIHQRKIKQISISDNIRALGVRLTLALTWKTQFEVLRNKVLNAMGKVMNTHLTYQQTSMHYNLCMLINLCCRCGIVKLHEKKKKQN